jgi:hypothetical protein
MNLKKNWLPSIIHFGVNEEFVGLLLAFGFKSLGPFYVRHLDG